MGRREDAIRSRLINYYDNYKVMQSMDTIGVPLPEDVHDITYVLTNLTDEQCSYIFADLGGREEDLVY
jgi:hypothetical protein